MAKKRKRKKKQPNGIAKSLQNPVFRQRKVPDKRRKHETKLDRLDDDL